MARTVNPIKKDIVKQSIKAGKTYKQALLDANYAIATASHNISPKNKLLNTVNAEIQAELKASDITVDLVIKHLSQDRELARLKGDIGTMARVDELLGKFLAIFTERQSIQTEDITQEQRNILSRYIDSTKASN